MADISTLRLFGFLFLLVVVQREGGVVSAELSDRAREADKQNCFETVSSWSEAQLHDLSSLPSESALDRVELRNLLFFLHIPRTGGRTFNQCFLKHLLPSDQRCPRSYDKLRIDRNQPGCRLISTHDDYSLVDKLPLDMTSVVTSLRQPVDRVLSSYEFSIEVAARSLRKVVKIPKKVPRKGTVGSNFMSTYDIWPWKYLVPTMEQDLFARQDERRHLEDSSPELLVGTNVTGLTENDSYDAALIAMPFHEFIHHPVAHELVHNGATFQVAGLTNISYSENAGALRHCVIRFPRLGKYVVEVAKKRLDRMLYVGLTERQNQSALFFAKVLGDQISMEVLMRGLLNQRIASRKARLSAPKIQPNFTSLDGFTKEEVNEEMMVAYEDCVTDLRNIQIDRRSQSLGQAKPIKFSRERRKSIPDSVMAEVARLNELDQELYAHAEVLFQQQEKYLQHGDFDNPDKMSNEDSDTRREGLKASYEFIYNMEDLAAIWGLIVLCVLMIPVILATGIYYATKRRGTRVKET